MIILFPIGWPIAKALDCIIGHEEKHLSKAILVSFLKGQKDVLSEDEIKMSTGAITLMRRKVSEITIKKIFFLRETDIFSEDLVEKIKSMGYSRIPIYNQYNECVKILITKSMIYGNYKDLPIIECPFKFVTPIPICETTNAFNALGRMKKYRTTLLMVVKKNPNEKRDSKKIEVNIIYINFSHYFIVFVLCFFILRGVIPTKNTYE
jgi:CBS domain containing-hemolysin-like protein